jgi:hypothetical protein
MVKGLMPFERTFMSKFSALELIHPDGFARTALVLGKNCPGKLRPELPIMVDGTTDLFILAPSAEECGSEGWLEAAIQSLSQVLSADGIGYVFVTPRWRWMVMGKIHRAGLIMGTSFWHFPDWSSSRYMVSMERNSACFTIDAMLAVSPAKRFLARQMFRYASMRWLLTVFWMPVAITVRRPDARPLFEWMFQIEKAPPAGMIVRTSWRGGDGASIVYSIPGDMKLPTVIAKTVPAHNANDQSRETQVLEGLGDTVRQTGMQVPEVIGTQDHERRFSLLLSYVPGQSVSDILASNASLFSPVMTSIVDWLERWHRLTVVFRSLKWDQFEQVLLKPLDRLSPSMQGAENYRSWLVARSQVAAMDPVPLVAAHNDLTMSNVLLDEHGQLGVVDWETACSESLPLVDFYYALTDAVRIADHCRDWLTGFKACFLPEGSYNAAVITWHERLQSAVQLPPGLAELCFHACWLHHASDEHRTSRPGEPRPFLEIVQWLASDESKFNK